MRALLVPLLLLLIKQNNSYGLHLPGSPLWPGYFLFNYKSSTYLWKGKLGKYVTWKINFKKCPEYHSHSLPGGKIQLSFLFFASFQRFSAIYEHFKHTHTQMVSCYMYCSANISWICFHISKYRLTSSVNSSLVIRDNFSQLPYFFWFQTSFSADIPRAPPIPLPVSSVSQAPPSRRRASFPLLRFCSFQAPVLRSEHPGRDKSSRDTEDGIRGSCDLLFRIS